MAVPTSVGKSKGPLINPAQCRCCRANKKCRILTAEYEWMDQKEVYSDMFMDCFGLLLSHLDGEDMECCICATCVVRLREAVAFRRQVLECERIFLTAMLLPKEEPEKKLDVEVKPEPPCDDDSLTDDEEDSHKADTEPIEVILKREILKLKLPSKRERKLKKAKTKSKLKKSTVKKEIMGKMKKLKVKLDSMIDQPAPAEKERRLTKKQKAEHLNQYTMAVHNATTIVQNSYVCPFTNRTSMYYCYYCKDQFINPEELRSHTLTHDPGTFQNMIEYNKLPKIDVTRIDCRLCSDRIEDIDSFKNHITNAHGKSMHPVTNEFLKFKLTIGNIKCIECSEVFPYFDSLMKHMIDHFGSHICDQCGACFLEASSLRSHMRTRHDRVVNINFPCEICGKILKTKYSKYLHVVTVHEKKPIVNCYKCEASFMSYALRNKHLIEVHGDNRTFPCKLCDKVYNRRKTLVEHNRRNHLKVFRHQCDLCDQRFYLPSRLKEHMATHTGERNFRCDYCDKSYPRLQSLQEHVRTHNHEKRSIKCQVCGSGFAQHNSLKNHMKNLHQYEMDAGFT